ncbi:collagen alpha-1(XXII) chain-like [Oscarella lobularis]|uniref:collagen alpha-1(XXII) chain-like n=1 Tax=Oscarella lobularis TaxID=121494 RepID=UPI0033136999
MKAAIAITLSLVLATFSQETAEEGHDCKSVHCDKYERALKTARNLLEKDIPELGKKRGIPGLPGIPGEPGPNGPTGFSGSMGKQGRMGTPGQPGHKGEAGEPGRFGVNGEIGQFGEKGRQGSRGERGDRGDKGVSAIDLFNNRMNSLEKRLQNLEKEADEMGLK